MAILLVAGVSWQFPQASRNAGSPFAQQNTIVCGIVHHALADFSNAACQMARRLRK
jgi:hypothetical protein